MQLRIPSSYMPVRRRDHNVAERPERVRLRHVATGGGHSTLPRVECARPWRFFIPILSRRPHIEVNHLVHSSDECRRIRDGREVSATSKDEGPHDQAVMPLVLVVDDDARMRTYLVATFSDQGFHVVDAESGARGLEQAKGYNPDLVVLDFALPDLDGLEVTTRLRAWTPVPILILSAYDDDQHKIAILDAGANDFLTKPFSTGELLARIRVWLRYIQQANVDSTATVLDVGELRIDFAKRTAYARGTQVRLTPTQFKLFGAMMRNADKILTHEEILTMVWGRVYASQTQYLRVYMGKLRQMFEIDPARPRHFVTEPGVGYRLRGD
jgi:two-component system, OmpR family, KDP operon response regulator KdpE